MFKLFNSYGGRIILAIITAALVIAILVLVTTKPTSPVPKNIANAVAYPIYYPVQAQLPKGYRLDTSSFESGGPGVVIFTITYGKNNIIVFTEQPMPSHTVIAKYASSYIPLHSSLTTALGQALYGAYNDGGTIKSVISLPINHGPWLIATAPSTINQAVFLKILSAMTQNY